MLSFLVLVIGIGSLHSLNNLSRGVTCWFCFALQVISNVVKIFELILVIRPEARFDYESYSVCVFGKSKNI